MLLLLVVVDVVTVVQTAFLLGNVICGFILRILLATVECCVISILDQTSVVSSVFKMSNKSNASRNKATAATSLFAFSSSLKSTRGKFYFSSSLLLPVLTRSH